MTDFSNLQQATVNLGTASVEVVRDPSENNVFYFTESSASLAIGFSENWLRRTRTKNQGKTLKALEGLGFKPVPLEGRFQRQSTGMVSSNLVTLDQFLLLTLYAATKGNSTAIAIQLALGKMSLIDFCRDAFGQEQETIAQKRARFYKEVAKTINWLKEDRQEVALIEEQLAFVGELN